MVLRISRHWATSRFIWRTNGSIPSYFSVGRSRRTSS